MNETSLPVLSAELKTFLNNGGSGAIKRGLTITQENLQRFSVKLGKMYISKKLKVSLLLLAATLPFETTGIAEFIDVGIIAYNWYEITMFLDGVLRTAKEEGLITDEAKTGQVVKDLGLDNQNDTRINVFLSNRNLRAAAEVYCALQYKKQKKTHFYVYRGLNEKDANRYFVQKKGLQAKNVSGKWSVQKHIVDGSSQESLVNEQLH